MGPKLVVEMCCRAGNQELFLNLRVTEINYTWYPGQAYILICCWGTSSKVNHFHCLEKWQVIYHKDYIYIMATQLQQPWSSHKVPDSVFEPG